MATNEQARAKFALGKVLGITSNDANKPQLDRYKTQLLKLPARLHANGLGQTVAFYLSAGPGKAEVTICGWLQEWLRPANANVNPDNKSLIECVTGSDGATNAEERYRRASAEARALSIWLKRFAEAFIQGDQG